MVKSYSSIINTWLKAFEDIKHLKPIDINTIKYSEFKELSYRMNDVINKLKESNEILERERLYFKSVFEYSPEALVLLDKTGKIEMVNNEFIKLFGYTKNELIGNDIDNMISGWEYKDEGEALNSKVIIGEKVEVETVRFNKNGKKIPVSTLAIKLKEANGKEMIFAAYRDVSDKKAQEKKALIQQNVIKLINKILRHDLMNYFAVLKSAFRLYEDSKNEELLKEAAKHVVKGIALIRTMKSLEQFGVADGNLYEIDAYKEIQDVADSFSGIKFNITGNCVIKADKAFSRIVENLINNALKHGGATKIDIELMSNKSGCTIRIKDNGSGIEKKIKKSIFEEGFSYGKSGNTGLGLYIVKNLMNIYNGAVEIEDNIPQGTTFILKFY